MTALHTQTQAYQRAPQLLWRDTGSMVLVLPAHGHGDVMVLGGGSAVLWRMLATRRSLDDLMDAFADTPEPPTADQLVGALGELLALGVLAADARSSR